MQYWGANQIINQVAGELGLGRSVTLFSPEDVNAIQNVQLVAALNSAGNELGFYYPWAQLKKQWTLPLVIDQVLYDLPSGWSYFIDQTQWDTTNHGPLLGPKSAAEWAWLKGSQMASMPSMRYRVIGNKFEIYPVPSSEYVLSMEYVSENWVQHSPSLEPNASLVIADGDIAWIHPWLLIKYTKLKWLQLKDFPSASAAADFQRMFDSLKGKDTGAEVLSLVHTQDTGFIGVHSIPEGNWNV